MFVALKGGRFEACPEFAGRGVIADFTPLRKQQSQFGERDVFKSVVEVDLEREDGSRYCVWSNNMTPSLHEKANLRKFVKSVLGRDLTKKELEGFDLESLIGHPVHIVVVQEHKDGETYANIAVIKPHKDGEPLKLSGTYTRVKDREARNGDRGSGSGSGYRRAEPMNAERGTRSAESSGEPGAGLLATKIHVGRCKGLELRDLSPEQVQALVEKWLPAAKTNPKPLADDRRLMAALDWWVESQSVPAGEPEDDVNY
jgi:hypothetical protein